VNGKDLNKTIKIKLEYEKSSIGSSYFDVIDLIKNGDIPSKLDDDELSAVDFAAMESAAVAAENIAIEFEIAWTERSGGNAYVKAYNIDLDDKAIATLTSDEGSNPTITGLNYLHPLLLPENYDEWLLDLFENQGDIHNDLLKKVYDLQGIEPLTDAKSKLAAKAKRDKLLSTVTKIEDEIAYIEIEKSRAKDNEDIEVIKKLTLKLYVLDEQLLREREKCLWVMPDFPVFKDEAFVSDFHTLLCAKIPPAEFNNSNYMTSINFKTGDNTFLHSPLSFESLNGALPKLGTSLIIEFEGVNRLQTKATHEIISDVVVAPLDNLLQLLKESLSIGPLRAVPTKESQPQTIPTQKEWFDGSAGWACLVREQECILPIISKKLDRGIYKELSNEIDAALGANTITKTDIWLSKLGYQLASEQAVGKQNLLYAQASIMQLDEWFSGSLGLYDLHNKVFVQPSDTGVGVSQLLPLIVAAVTIKKGFVAIEQPELHVHPRVQVDVGDLLTQIVDGPNFIVETHSEHIILRLLKRIRQTTDGELPEGFLPVTPDDVSINYLNSSEHGVQITRLNIDEDGEFIERWPGGFFAERREELW
jgi:hypothetical protein